MYEITWPQAIEIARRREHTSALPLSIVCNGARGDFLSLQSTGIPGQVLQDTSGEWFVRASGAHLYLHDGATVWVG